MRLAPILRYLAKLALTVVYAVVGVFCAFPLSYWFQDSIYSEMTWRQYLAGGMDSIRIGGEFGAADVYRYTLIGSMIVTIILGRLLTWYITARWRKAKSDTLGK